MANQYRSVLAGGASSGGDALPAEVLSGKTFTNDNGAQTGTMTNNGAVSQTLAAGASYTIPEGYHNGNGTVTAENGFSGVLIGRTFNSTTVTENLGSGVISGAVVVGTKSSISYTIPSTLQNYMIVYKDGTTRTDNDGALPASPIDATNIAALRFQASASGNYTFSLS